jgi:hypothetical protein
MGLEFSNGLFTDMLTMYDVAVHLLAVLLDDFKAIDSGRDDNDLFAFEELDVDVRFHFFGSPWLVAVP